MFAWVFLLSVTSADTFLFGGPQDSIPALTMDPSQDMPRLTAWARWNWVPRWNETEQRCREQSELPPARVLLLMEFDPQRDTGVRYEALMYRAHILYNVYKHPDVFGSHPDFVAVEINASGDVLQEWVDRITQDLRKPMRGLDAVPVDQYMPLLVR